jgi:hypothetical protein
MHNSALNSSKSHLLTLYFLDSHGYANNGWTFWKPAEYDWIKPVRRECNSTRFLLLILAIRVKSSGFLNSPRPYLLLSDLLLLMEPKTWVRAGDHVQDRIKTSS